MAGITLLQEKGCCGICREKKGRATGFFEQKSEGSCPEKRIMLGCRKKRRRREANIYKASSGIANIKKKGQKKSSALMGGGGKEKRTTKPCIRKNIVKKSGHTREKGDWEDRFQKHECS